MRVITTKRAYQDLENEGLIHIRPGIGTFVNHVTIELLHRIGSEIIKEKLTGAVQASAQIGMSAIEIKALLKKFLNPKNLLVRRKHDEQSILYARY